MEKHMGLSRHQHCNFAGRGRDRDDSVRYTESVHGNVYKYNFNTVINLMQVQSCPPE
jgi:hypothetical protein